jgi:hypothetical protein
MQQCENSETHHSEFGPDDLMAHQGFAKGLARQRMLPGLLDTRPRHTYAHDCQVQSLGVKIGHDHSETISLLPDKVFDWDLDIVQFKER